MLAAALNLTAVAAEGPGYLRTVGPVGLRFFPMPVPMTNQIVLPPPPPPIEPVVVPKADTNAVVVPPPVEHEAITNEASSLPPALPEPQRSDDVVSPQVFLKYFNKSTNGVSGTNGSSATVAAPLDFTPPKAAEPAPSKAAYSTGP
ncbi:MAG TPA: hypothetical protein VH413_02875 [Verrucomicrobiae bacterium]|nr:hypothetical protein [Verrucomicrobiae bacterium]